MPRPKKNRRCECRLADKTFKPAGIPLCDLPQIELAYDELETIKLCDLDGLTQEEAGERMGVSRGTVQRLLTSARQKTARALVKGEALICREEKDGLTSR